MSSPRDFLFHGLPLEDAEAERMLVFLRLAEAEEIVRDASLSMSEKDSRIAKLYRAFAVVCFVLCLGGASYAGEYRLFQRPNGQVGVRSKTYHPPHRWRAPDDTGARERWMQRKREVERELLEAEKELEVWRSVCSNTPAACVYRGGVGAIAGAAARVSRARTLFERLEDDCRTSGECLPGWVR